MRNPWGFIVWIDDKFQDGLPKWWANKCLDCYSSASLDWGVILPTSWGQGVYMAWDWSADCGLKPNGHTICYLLPETINLLPLGQTQLLFFRFTQGEKFMIFLSGCSWYAKSLWLDKAPTQWFYSIWSHFHFPSRWVHWGQGLCQGPAVWYLVWEYDSYPIF